MPRRLAMSRRAVLAAPAMSRVGAPTPAGPSMAAAGAAPRPRAPAGAAGDAIASQRASASATAPYPSAPAIASK
eukprot:5619819-Pleurochrysis_carterae.AAC.1